MCLNLVAGFNHFLIRFRLLSKLASARGSAGVDVNESLLNSAGLSLAFAMEEILEGFSGLIWVIWKIFGFSDQVMLKWSRLHVWPRLVCKNKLGVF